jgi:hypothetical protein
MPRHTTLALSSVAMVAIAYLVVNAKTAYGTRTTQGDDAIENLEQMETQLNEDAIENLEQMETQLNLARMQNHLQLGSFDSFDEDDEFHA